MSEPLRRRDVFVSYAHENADWVRVLVADLREAGLDVFFDEWDIVEGQRLSQRLQEGLAASRVVVLVVSAAAVDKQWWQEEFAAAMAGVIAGSQRLVPVLLDDGPVPPFVAGRAYIDFRYAESPDAHRVALAKLLAAVRDQPAVPGVARGGGTVVRPMHFRAEGPRLARLRIAADRVVFSTGGRAVEHPPRGLDSGLRTLLIDLHRTRNRPEAGDPAAVLRGPGGALHSALIETGRALGMRFADGPAGQAVAEQIAAIAPGGASLRLAVQVDDPELADLPWETLVLPGQDIPLVLQAGVQLHRALDVPDPVAVAVAGPLRILAVVASPDHGGGELLDYEAELARILQAVDPSRRRDGAYVRVLNWGTPEAIREALAQQRFHILHISCHAKPGVLVLESDTGAVEEVDAARFGRDILVRDQGVPLVVLAGCSTALGTRVDSGGDAEGEQALPGLARDLLRAGVPAVLAMTAPVTDRYATDLCAELYRELTSRPEPVPLAELSFTRQRLEERRLALPASDPRAVWAEWATPALFQSGPALPLHRGSGDQPVPVRVEARVQLGGMIRQVGDFVGRRAELRAILRDLRGTGAGAVLHGIGGIGKSSLAAELVSHLGADAGLVVPISGSMRVDLLLEEIRRRLVTHCLNHGVRDQDPLRRAAAALIDVTPPWAERLATLRDVVLPRLPILLLLDNAEDELTHTDTGVEIGDPELAGFVTAWIRLDGTRLIVTTRYPFTLPRRAERRLSHHHLGPLSEAETRKLIWRLPAVDRLDARQRRRAYADVGGHPRSLEYLDALLAGGKARFEDVADRLEDALAWRGVDDPEGWLADVGGDLDRATAETITLAADDVLLDALLVAIDAVPWARDLLLGAAVYPEPVHDIGLAWQIADEIEEEPDPDRDQRMRVTGEILTRARQENISPEEAGLTPEQREQWDVDWAQRRRPPLDIPAGFGPARDALLHLGLLSPVTSADPADGDAHYLVHRWTALALAARIDPERLTEAHRRAARYWRWRVDVWPQDRAADIAQLLLARRHHHQAGDLPDAIDVSYTVRDQLHTWGAWTWEHDLCTETLDWLPDRTHDRASFLHQLGMIAELRGDYEQAEQRYHTSLTIDEEIGDRAGIATSYHQLGMIAELRGDYTQAEQRYHTSLTILEELGNRAGIATSYHQLGMIAQLRGDYEQAEQRYHASLTILEELGDRAGIAGSYHQLGRIAELRGDYEQAEQRYHASLAIKEELGNRAGIATTTSQLGALRTQLGQAADAVSYNLVALSIRAEIGSPEVNTDLYWLARQRRELGDRAFRELLDQELDAASVEAVLEVTDNIPADED